MTALRVIPLGSERSTARLDAFLYVGEKADRAIWLDRDGERFAVRSHVRARDDGVRIRTRVRSVESGTGWRAVDRQVFELRADRFVELPTRASAGSFDVPLVLPAVLTVGEAHRPHPSDPRTVTLMYVGAARLALPAANVCRDAIALRLAGLDGVAWDQWLVEGVGEVALGPADEAAQRWLVGWRSGDGDDALFVDGR